MERTIIEEAWVEVEAFDADHAEAIFMEKFAPNPDQFDWDIIDCNLDITEITEEP